jgi:hypothetical protein
VKGTEVDERVLSELFVGGSALCACVLCVCVCVCNMCQTEIKHLLVSATVFLFDLWYLSMSVLVSGEVVVRCVWVCGWCANQEVLH